MRPLKRKPLNKARSARTFRSKTKRVHPMNVRVMRGGIRL